MDFTNENRPDIFLSYAFRDLERAKTIASALESSGFKVWWDMFVLPGERFRERIERYLHESRCVVVLWSEYSVISDHVRREADLAVALGKIIPVRLDHVKLPLQFEYYVTADLIHWTGSLDDREFQRLIEGVQRVTGKGVGRMRLPDRGEMDTTVLAPYPPSVVTGDPIQLAVSSPAVIGRIWDLTRAYFYEGSSADAVQADAEGLLHGSSDDRGFAYVHGSRVPLGSKVTAVIEIPDADCVPRRDRFTWKGRWHKTDFHVRYVGPGRADPDSQRGRVSWFAGPVCVGTVPFQVSYSAAIARPPQQKALSKGRGFRKVFISYSHKDSLIVDWLQSSPNPLGLTYLRDTKDLRSGQVWSEELQTFIKQADLFQLFWSHNARESTEVEKEWRYALGLDRDEFLRPCHWDRPRPPAPPELERLQFEWLPLDWRTRVRLRLRRWFS